MRAELTLEEIERYRTDGFTVVPGLLDAAEVEHWRTVIDRAVEARGRENVPGSRLLPVDLEELPAAVRVEVEYYQRVFTQRMNLWQVDDEARELVIDPRIGRMAAMLAGVDGIRLFHDQALYKEAWGNPTAFHLDVPYWSFTSRQAISLWVALDDVTPQNGALAFLPGSQRTARFRNVGIGRELGALFEKYPEWNEIEPVMVPMRAGDASFHSGLTAHGAAANLTPRPRRAMTLQMMPEGSTYNGRPNILPPDYVATLTEGDVLDRDDVNPLLWSRARAAAG